MLKEIMIERGAFFKGIAQILSLSEKQEFICEEKDENKPWKNKEDELLWGNETYKTYSICLNGKPLISHKALSERLFMDDVYPIIKKENLDYYAKFSEIKSAIQPLLEQYPYLSILLVDEIGAFCLNNNGKISVEQMLSLAKSQLNKSVEQNNNKSKVFSKINK